jgi:hypothetical protein
MLSLFYILDALWSVKQEKLINGANYILTRFSSSPKSGRAGGEEERSLYF